MESSSGMSGLLTFDTEYKMLYTLQWGIMEINILRCGLYTYQLVAYVYRNE